MSAKRLLLVDGTNVVMRYAHAMMPQGSVTIPDSSDALQRRATDVFSAVERAIRECATVAGATHAVVAVDDGDSWRYDLFPSYKVNRASSRTSWWSGCLQAHLRDRAIHVESAARYEADDVIATLDERARRAGLLTAVLSGDSDLLVLASESCDVYQFGRKDEPRFVRRSPEWIAEKYGISEPKHLRAYKALVGEPGDGLPGLDGYGPVKARTLLTRFGSAEGILESVALTQEQHERFTLMLSCVGLATSAPLDPIVPATCRLIAA